MTPGGGSFLRTAAAASLALWALLGLAHTTVVLGRPDTGLFLERDGDSARVIGVPWDLGARFVTQTLDLLDQHAPGAAPVLIVGREAVDPGVYDYVVFQLSHLAYPRELDFEGVHQRRTDPEYAAAIAFGGGAPGPHWELHVERGDVALFLPRRP